MHAQYVCTTSTTTYEIDANGGDVGLGVGVVGEPQQQARLSDTGVSNQQELEEKIAVRGGRDRERA
jgi:hypothetical protein